ncbi:MAG: hypothetical protein M3R65_09715 [Gemmatimonadota bacterium]|nr:hypothetical protein [Gemmatimonadota bacterium]
MFSKIPLIGLTAAAALFATAPAQAAAPTVAQQSAVAGRRVRQERHPEIRRAISALERARSSMQSANHDFGGHRADALAACDNAIAQLKLALQFDNK